MNQPSSEKLSLDKKIKRFICGAMVGILLATIYWSYSAYFRASFSLTHGIVSSLILAIACGVITTFTSVDKLMDNFPQI